MTRPDRRKGGGSKLARSQTVQVRLVPKVRYLADLAARKHRRTLSSFIEWAIEDSFSKVILLEDPESRSLADEAPDLWDVDEPDRFATLAMTHPDLLNHEEQILWKLIRETGHLWAGEYDDEGQWAWYIRKEALMHERLREQWDNLLSVARGEQPRDILPKVSEKPSPPPTRETPSRKKTPHTKEA
jgi:hypothetical protein